LDESELFGLSLRSSGMIIGKFGNSIFLLMVLDFGPLSAVSILTLLFSLSFSEFTTTTLSSDLTGAIGTTCSGFFSPVFPSVLSVF